MGTSSLAEDIINFGAGVVLGEILADNMSSSSSSYSPSVDTSSSSDSSYDGGGSSSSWGDS
jgi:hypothetical protein